MKNTKCFYCDKKATHFDVVQKDKDYAIADVCDKHVVVGLASQYSMLDNSMGILEVHNIFSDEEIKGFYQEIERYKDADFSYDEKLGRKFLLRLEISTDAKEKINNICNNFLGIDLKFTHVAYAEYSNLYGTPNLPPHFDADNNTLVVDYQLESNTSWDLGINLKQYELKDNSALIFNANENVHWRPHKIFKSNEYVKMLFFRFYDPENTIDYSNKDYWPSDDIFKDIRKIRDNPI